MSKKSKKKTLRPAEKAPPAPLPAASRPIPPLWGDDALSQFLQVAHENSFFVFTQHRRVYDLVALTHEAFDVLVGLAASSSPKYLSFFVARAHSAYLASLRLALAGEVAESFAPLRVSIETAWYGLHVSADPDATKRMQSWLSRDDNEQAKWDVVKLFRSGDLKRTHQDKDPETAKILEHLYERCISYGAHPNPAGLLTNMIREEDHRSITHKVLYLNAQVMPLMFALKTCVEVAVGIVRVFGLVYPKQYVASGMLQRLEALVSTLNVVFQPYTPRAR